eukprot:TRINITY_DN50868_c0_g1_i2.p1 TRINITY_DN50868_c0_g1~~TRINITY_DN50868_c0_g1_i2.p1  ORF type:complete len:581 (+),score=40.05 TRINITY_DN50868_c0_g1_i2:263-1744(+)
MVFLALLFNWHNIISKLRKSKLLFVDKLCIAQHDEELKSHGILGLGGFLKISQRLVVLWSPTYFSRLWCTFELAAWFRYENSLSSVLFVPVEIPLRLVCVFLVNNAATVVYYIEVVLGSETSFITFAFGYPFWVMITYVIQGQVEHVAGLEKAFDTFQVQRTACFCCSTDHRHPVTGLPLACDRQLVYSTMRSWLEGSGLDLCDDDHLSIFNKEVRTSLKHHVISTLPERHLFLRYTDFLVMSSSTVWLAADLLILRLRRDDTNAWLYFTMSVSMWLFGLPLILSITCRIIHRCTGERKKSRKVKFILAVCVWGPACFTLYCLLFMCLYPGLYIQVGVIWPFYVVLVVVGLVSHCVFTGGVRRGKHVPTATFSLTNGSAATRRQSKVQVTVDCSHARADQHQPEMEQDIPTPAGMSLRQAASEYPCPPSNQDRGGTEAKHMYEGRGSASSDMSIAVLFDDSWQLVTEANSLTALGPVYSVDVGGGEMCHVMRL